MKIEKKLIKELREINKITRIEKPYRISILESDIPLQFKAIAMKKVNALRYAEPGSGEYSKLTDIHMLAQGAEASLSFEPYRCGQILAKVPKCAFVSTAKFYLFG